MFVFLVIERKEGLTVLARVRRLHRAANSQAGHEDLRRTLQENIRQRVISADKHRAGQIRQESNKWPSSREHEVRKKKVARGGGSKLYPGDTEGLLGRHVT